MRVIPLLALMAGMFLGQSSVLPGGQLQRVSVTVRDGTGGLVHGLSAEDFLIEEDGEPQTIAAFHRDPKIPVSLGILIARHGFLGFGSSRIFLRTAAAPGDELALMVPARRAFGVKVPFTADPMSIETGILELYDPERFWGRTEPSTVEQIRRALKVMGDARHSRKGLVVFGWDFEGNQGILRDVRAAEVPVYMMRTGGGVVLISEESLDERAMRPLEEGETAGLVEALRDRGLAREEIAMKSIAEAGSGQYAFADSRNAVNDAIAFAENVSVDLRGQYVLEYYSTDPSVGHSRVLRVKSLSSEYRVTFRRLPVQTPPSSSR